jgi:hypothetical protein
MGGLAHHTRQDEVERNYSSLVGHGPLETYFHYQHPTYYFCGIYLILHLVSAHDDGLGCLGIGRRTLANKQTGQPNWAADEKYDQVRIVEIAIQ